ncbi:MAG: cell division protein ZapA [Alphaproteobacteria bacterium]|nr:cell division protein ZapA [Alphaproteobacteria bacterium]NNF25164.1 cell division protein ZapA [Paracoccaceae bacterium]
MPEVNITIGGRQFEVACQEGEEHFLQAAAQMLDNEAAALLNQIGRMPESRMLLMAGLLLADKTAGADDKVRLLEKRVGALQAELEGLREAPGPEPTTVEVAVIPPEVTDTLADFAARAEALAASVEEKLAS